SYLERIAYGDHYHPDLRGLPSLDKIPHLGKRLTFIDDPRRRYDITLEVTFFIESQRTLSFLQLIHLDGRACQMDGRKLKCMDIRMEASGMMVETVQMTFRQVL